MPATLAPRPSASPAPGPTAVVATVWVGETGGGGTYLRNSPHDGDRAGVLPDGPPEPSDVPTK